MFLIKTIKSFLSDEEYRNLLVTSVSIIILGTVSYRYLEGWTWLDSLYFSIITLTTIGYGDFSPQTNGGKVFTIFYILLGIGIILGFVNTVYHHYTDSRFSTKEKTKK